MKKKHSKRKYQSIKVKVDIETALGRAHREQYLEENPHGFRAIKKVHKNKQAYNRKKKHKKASSYSSVDDAFFIPIVSNLFYSSMNRK
ncbi:MAG: hypothetical protein MK212_05380 [Saprospiraceae bacterium]|nr:hypothetical protein [Saprospiraceae bacterium]